MKLLFGVGLNDTNDRKSDVFIVWSSMLARCYRENSHKCYMDAKVCDEWLVFSSFKSWALGRHKKGLQLDKDILSEGEKVYSPKTCVFIPQNINKLLTNTDDKGAYLTGVTYHKPTGKFRARISHNNKRVSLGLYRTEMDAHMAYIRGKMDVVFYHASISNGEISKALFLLLSKLEKYYKQKLKDLLE